MTSPRELAIFLTNDLSAITRGRAFPAADLSERRRSGVGWVPANLALTPFGVIASDNPFGPVGDLRLIPDAGDEGVVLAGPDEMAPTRAFLCDVRNTDGSAWPGCGRTLLKGALDELKEMFGLGIVAAFEHEFLLSGVEHPARQAFSFQDFRAAEPFLSAYVEALSLAGVEPETILPEYGPCQVEVTHRPAPALAAADRAVLIREIGRDMARRFGLTATFAPIVDPASVGNGVHIHFSLVDADGRNVTADLSRRSEIGSTAASFVAGIIRHLPAICAITAPTNISYLRLTPHRWSAGYTCFGHRNREAAVRVCPTIDLPGRDRATQIHLEFRAADAGSSPYMALAFIVRAGIRGLIEALPEPPLVEGDPADLNTIEGERLGIRRLPDSLPAAIRALRADETALAWMPEPMRSTYLSMKSTEIEMTKNLEPKARCLRYAEVY